MKQIEVVVSPFEKKTWSVSKDLTYNFHERKESVRESVMYVCGVCM